MSEQKKKDLVVDITKLMFEAYPELICCDVDASLQVSRQLAHLIGYTLAIVKVRTNDEMFNKVIDKIREHIVAGTGSVLESAIRNAEEIGKTAGFSEDKIKEVSDAIRSKMEKTTTH